MTSRPEISGAYDLVLHNYGPDTFNGTVHIEIPDTLSAGEIDKLIRSVSLEVYQKHGVALTAIGIYTINTKDPEAVEARKAVEKIVLGHEHVLQLHGFYYDKAEKSIRFDMVVSFNAPDRTALYREVCDAVREKFPGYTIQAFLDIDFS